METDNFDAEVPASPNKKNIVVVLIVGVIVVAAVAAIVYRLGIFNTKAPEVVEPPIEEPSVVSGTIYFNAVPAGSDNRIPYVYRYDVGTKEIERYLERPGHSYLRGDDEFGIFITSFESEAVEDQLRPAWYNVETDEVGPLGDMHGYKENYLSGVPNGSFYAYSYLADETADETDIRNWSVAVHDREGELQLTIPEAAKPAFNESGTVVYYMTADGLRSRSLFSEESTPVFPQATSLSWSDNYSISPNGQVMVFSSPSANTLLVNFLQQTDNGLDFVTFNAIEGAGEAYFHSVSSPDSLYFAVLKLVDNEFIMEIRSVLDTTLIDSIVLNDFTPHSIQLTNWSND